MSLVAIYTALVGKLMTKRWQDSVFMCRLWVKFQVSKMLLSMIKIGISLVLRGDMTKASSKQWAGILLMPKIDREHKNDLTSEIWEEK